MRRIENRRKKIGNLLGVLGIALGTWLSAGSTRAAEREERALEGKLLNQALPLGSVQTYSRSRKAWQPLRLPPARVFVVNLWSKSCAPCLAEMPDLRALAEDMRSKARGDVQLLLIADPPEQTSAADVVKFWEQPFVDGLAGRCPKHVGDPIANGGQPSCLIRLPDVDPARSQDRKLIGAEVRPVTLLLDGSLTVRQVLVGSIKTHQVSLADAVERLLAAERAHPRPGKRI
jgi:thiol-disulfide isomerase/thioredoxin